jgi:hypothetical protein
MMTPGTTRRLTEIAKRNKLRREAGLPLLQVIKELRRMKKADVEAAFELFAKIHRPVLQEILIKRWREQIGNPHWRPTFLQGQAIANQVRKQLHKFQKLQQQQRRLDVEK